jgi:NADH-ubiquinone oxidoreductase chain 5
MEGPTPVSALIHAATMVTAGVFLLVKMSLLFECTNFVLKFISLIGALTAFFAATIGLVQNDLKKVIAYSTCSQLGYMILICGLSNYNLGMFHLVNHAFFKALLFLTAGAIIHSVQDEQDIRRLGGLKTLLPLSYVGIVIGSLALIGFPFLAGFYSKDIILEYLYSSYSQLGHFTYSLGILAACGTTFYSFRLLYLVFLANTKAYKVIIQNAHDVTVLMSIPLIILTFGSIFIGYFLKDMMIGFGTPF